MIKKGFTLTEVLVSITIFSIVIVFLYQSLNLSKTFNNTFSNHVTKYEKKLDFQKILFEDIIETNGRLSINNLDKNKNTILKIEHSNNTYHNPFNKYITYIVSNNKNLLRIESYKEFKIDSVMSEFVNEENTYIDILQSNIEYFKVLKNKKNTKAYTIYIKYTDNTDIVFSVLPFI